MAKKQSPVTGESWWDPVNGQWLLYDGKKWVVDHILIGSPGPGRGAGTAKKNSPPKTPKQWLKQAQAPARAWEALRQRQERDEVLRRALLEGAPHLGSGWMSNLSISAMVSSRPQVELVSSGMLVSNQGWLMEVGGEPSPAPQVGSIWYDGFLTRVWNGHSWVDVNPLLAATNQTNAPGPAVLEDKPKNLRPVEHRRRHVTLPTGGAGHV